MTPRAAPMTSDQRRTALVEATVPLLYQHGRGVTSKQIAEAAGVAEGTIFRVFSAKEELIDSAIVQALDLGPFLREVEQIDGSAGLRPMLLELTTLLQIRFRGVFALMAAVGMVGPPEKHRQHGPVAETRAELTARMTALVAAYADQLAVPPDELVHRLRLLTFAGSHPHITDGHTLTPDEIVGTVLDGLLTEKEH